MQILIQWVCSEHLDFLSSSQLMVLAGLRTTLWVARAQELLPQSMGFFKLLKKLRFLLSSNIYEPLVWGTRHIFCQTHNKMNMLRAQLLQSCPTLCDSMNHSLPGSSVHGIFQGRILEWVAAASSKGSSPPRNQIRISCIAGGFFMAEPPGKR